MDIWYMYVVRGNLVDFYPFWYFVPRKIWQLWTSPKRVKANGTTASEPFELTASMLMTFDKQ
jgi:hypothetical protein